MEERRKAMHKINKTNSAIIIILTLLSLVVSGCVWNKDKAPDKKENYAEQEAPQADGRLRDVAATLGADDVLDITVFREKNLSGIFRISPDGSIQYPLIGTIVAEGRTPAQISDEIRSRLSEGYLKEPHVSVFVKEFNSKKIFVFGQVQKPGTFRYEESMNIIQAITLAGGFTKTANGSSVSVTRKITDGEKRFKISVDDISKGEKQNFILQPGDIVFVPETLF